MLAKAGYIDWPDIPLTWPRVIFLRWLRVAVIGAALVLAVAHPGYGDCAQARTLEPGRSCVWQIGDILLLISVFRRSVLMFTELAPGSD